MTILCLYGASHVAQWYPPANAGNMGSIPGSGRYPGGGNGIPLQYSCVEKSHGQRNLVGYTVHRVTKNQDMHIFYIYNQNGGGDRYLFLIFNLWYSFVVGLSFLRHFSDC